MTYTFDDNTVSDLHKDAYGFRPSQSFWAQWAAFNGDQKQAVWDDLCDTLKATIAREKEEQEEAIAQFQDRLNEMYCVGAKDFEMAIRWMHDALDTNGDNEYLEFRLGLPYGHLVKARIANEDKGE